MENDTASLRDAAPKWTLAGDKQLLDILQNIHQSLMTRCQEVNRQLDEMVNALDDASVDLQNVNNKFMALSNHQFIESRVYDDDVDVTKQEAPKEAPPSTDTPSELTSILESTLVLQRWHDAVQICDDSDSDSDDVTSVVLKSKDVYSRRPLPHVIGTPAWKNKWHAGLLVEDSDTDSSTSKPAPDDEYSESEPDEPGPDRNDVTVTDTQGSSASSELFSEQDILPPVKSIPSKPTPSDVAAELARRLRGEVDQIPEEDPPFVPPQPTTNKVYRPEQPTTGTIFSDEPPPFEQYQSESEPEEDDIFAELHKKPYVDANKVQSQVVDELFGKERGLFKQLDDSEAPPLRVANQKSTLIEYKSEPELFASEPTNKPTERQDDTTTETVKKPIGGISLFGSNKGAESIGAAILKRNRRKSSSEEESLSDKTKPNHKEDKLLKTTEKDIFDDLFAKSEREQKVKKEKKETVVNKEFKTDKVDLFSDNLFDDIDDIFTTDVKVITKPNNNGKSLFDDTGDDLFANIDVTESVKVKSEIKNRSIFDSDDDLFSDNVKPETKTKGISETSKTSVSKTNELSKSIFDDDSIDGDMFTKLSETKVSSTKNNVTVKVNLSKSNEELKSSINTSNESRNTNTVYVTNNNFDTKIDKHKEKPPSLFDDDVDNDSDDIFKNIKKNTSVNNEKSQTTDASAINSNAKENKTDIKTKTSLFDDEDDDDNLFTNLSKSSTKDDEIKNIPPIEAKTKDYNIFHTSLKDSDNKEKEDNISDNNNTEKAPKDDVRNKIETSQTKSSIFDDDDNDTLFGDVKSSDKETSIPNKLLDSAPSPTNSKTDQNEIKSSTKLEGESELNLNKNEKTMKPKATEYSTINENNFKEVVKPDIPKPDFDSFSKSILEDNNTLFNTVNDAIFSTTDDIFSDLIDEPPAFEKPKEPKKSKNVNALFDDDSDDEALFFKKNDIIFDDKPDENADGNNDPIFGIFHYEPPAIDVDFTAKSEETVKNTSKTDSHDDIFKTSEKPTDAKMEISKGDINHNNNVSAHNQKLKKDLKVFVDSNSDSDNDLFQTSKTQKPVIATKPSQKDIIPTSSETKTKDEQIKKDEDLEPTIVEPFSPNESQSSDTPDSPEIKKIGKLKTMSFNIDVSTLLPGASPKKKSVEQTDRQVFSAKSQDDFDIDVSTLQPAASPKKKSVEQTDGQVISTKSKEDLNTQENVEQSIVKAVNFEGEPDSQILDNKISKERAKIQVKRRPSTRRARKEAVRKSVLDLGEDSTDNSSSFDDVPKEHRKTQNETKHDDNKERNETNKREIEQRVTSGHKGTNSENKGDIINDDTESRILTTNENSHIYIEGKTETDISETVTRKGTEISEIITRQDNVNNEDNVNVASKNIKAETELDKPSNISDVTNETKNVRFKVVYILNDEDIFNTPIEKPAENPKSITSIEDDSLFRNPVKIEETPSISTLGSVYKENKQENKIKKSIFDDLSDEENELFNTNNKKVLKTKGILDSDSEDDLFFGKKEMKDNVSKTKEMKDNVSKTKEMKGVKPKQEVKASLFGDDDDDDLFGAKVKIHQAPSQTERSKDVVVKPSQPVFDDPLSLLADDDD